MRAETETKITIRLDKKLHKELKGVAKRRDSDVSKVIRKASRFWIAQGCPEEELPAEIAVANN